MTGYLAFSSSPTIGWSVSFENQSNAEDYKDAIEAIGSLVDPDDMPIPPAGAKYLAKYSRCTTMEIQLLKKDV